MSNARTLAPRPFVTAPFVTALLLTTLPGIAHAQSVTPAEAPAAQAEAQPEATEAQPEATEAQPEATEAQPEATEAQPEEAPPPAEAMRRFELATARMDAGDFSAALTEFESVYALLVGHPRQFFVLYNLGLCQRQLFQYERALASFRQYLSALSPNDPERTEVEATIAALVAQLATLHVESNREGARVWLDNREVGAVNTDLLVPSGAHVIEVRQPGFEMARREVSLASGETVHVVLSLDALGDVHGIDVAFFATSAALTGASLIATVVAGSLALARRGEVDTCLSNDACRFDRNFDLDRQAIGDLAGATDALLITTGVLGVTTFVLAFVTDFGGSTATETALRISPSGVSLTGSF